LSFSAVLRPEGRRLLRSIAVVLTVVGGAWAVAFAVAAASDQFVYDAHAYWAVDPRTAYLLPEGSADAMLYAPPVMLAFSLFGHIPWPVFATVWSVLIALAITLMAGPFSLPAMLTNPVASEVTLGNIHAFLGLAVIAGFRKPAVWAFVVLTKVTPGIGLLWFVFRREWRNLGIALAATAILVIPTLVLAPELWIRWVQALVAAAQDRQHTSGLLAVPLVVRLAIAVVLLWIGARQDQAWVVPIAVTLSLPVLWDHALVLGLASIWLALHPDWVPKRAAPASERTRSSSPPVLAPDVSSPA
jgi:hypothetical protein